MLKSKFSFVIGSTVVASVVITMVFFSGIFNDETNFQNTRSLEQSVYVPSDITKANPDFIRLEGGHELWKTTDVNDVKDDVVYTIEGQVLSIDEPVDWDTGVILSTVQMDDGSPNAQILGFIPITISIANMHKGDLSDNVFTFYVASNKINNQYYIFEDSANFEIGENVIVHLAHYDDGPFPDGHYYSVLSKFSKYQIINDFAFNANHQNGISITSVVTEALP